METEDEEKLNSSIPSSTQPVNDSLLTTTKTITEINAEHEELLTSREQEEESKRGSELKEQSYSDATAIESESVQPVLPRSDTSATSRDENMVEPGAGGGDEETELTLPFEIGTEEVVAVASKEEVEGEGKFLVGSDDGREDGEGGVSSSIDNKDLDVTGKEDDEDGNMVATNVKEEDLSTRNEELAIDEEIGSGSAGEVATDVAVESEVMREKVEAVEEVNEGMKRADDFQVTEKADGSKEVDEERAAKSEVAEMVDEMGFAGETQVVKETEAVKEEREKDAEKVDDMEVANAIEGGDKEVEEEMESLDVGEEVEMVEQEEKVNEGEEMEMVEETEWVEGEEEASRTPNGKRKRGKSSKANLKVPSKKKLEEDVCFICFDGGELVLCDRRGCPKAYHPSCVNRNDAFFQSKGRWNCGWHICSTCQKNAYYMCYTCTFSLCKGCIKDAVIFCVRGNKGFCETCIKTIMLIEKNDQENKEAAKVDFDDKGSWEYLFKDYWIDLKERLSITSEDLAQARNPWKGSNLHTGKLESPDELNDTHNDAGSGSGSDRSFGNVEVTAPKRRKTKRRLKSRAKDRDLPSMTTMDVAEGVTTDGVEWASKELLEFVMHMKNGDQSVCSQFDVQALLLEYIKRNKLRDPRRKSQIICDSRLENLFGKPRVGHFEMLKLLESHFLLKEDSQADDLQGSVVDTEASHLEADGNSDALVKSIKGKKRKSRKKGDGRGMQSNLDDFAAIDMHNINLIYLRRSLLEDLMEDDETFHDKVVGAFVRIRISGSAQKKDLYRLVQVVGTNKAAESYRVGKRMTDILLEILNLNKTEVVSIDIISNQEFTEDECKRLRQSIKCGLINRLTVGDIQEKAIALQSVRVKDSLEAEITRISHLRDRASDMGRRKELRECVEKLQLLKSPEERQRRLEELPDIHTDPKMDPSYESEDDDDIDDKGQENYPKPRGSSFSRRATEPISPRKGGFASYDSWGGTRNSSSMNWELSRSMSGKGFSSKGDGFVGAGDTSNEHLWTPGRDREPQQLQNSERPKTVSSSEIQSSQIVLMSESVPKIAQEMVGAPPAGVMQSGEKVNETEKMWHYKDPSGKMQGPFSIVQLRKWNTTGYFPTDLRIWKTNENEDKSILLTDALNGNFQKSSPLVDNSLLKTQLLNSSHLASLHSGHAGDISIPKPEASISAAQAAPAPLEVPKKSADRWGSETNLPSPTPSGPAQTISAGMKDKAYRSRWSPTPAQPPGSVLAASPFSGGNGEPQHPALVISESGQLPTPTPCIDSTHMSHGVSPAAKPEVGFIRSSVNSQLQSLSDSSSSSVQPAFDIKSLQSLVQQVANNPSIRTHGWMAGTVSKPEMNTSPTVPGAGSGSQPWGNAPPQKSEANSSISVPIQPYGNWSNAPSSVPNVSTYGTGNPTGLTPMPGITSLVPSTPWRAPVPGQLNVQSSAPSNVQWAMNNTNNQSSSQQQGPENQNAAAAWGSMLANPSGGWGGSLPQNQNQGWTATGQGPSPGNATPCWGAPVQAQASGNHGTGWATPVQGQGYGNTFQGWAQTGQGSAPVNSGSGWVTPGQGSSTGNANLNPSWSSMPQTGNMGGWGSDKSQNANRPANHRDWDRSSHGGDSGHNGGRSWNRQSSFGRGEESSRSSNKGNRVCKYYESGHCKKGDRCDYLHT